MKGNFNFNGTQKEIEEFIIECDNISPADILGFDQTKLEAFFLKKQNI